MSGPTTAAPILAFAGVAAVLVITPGVGTTFLISTVIGHGRRAGYLTAIGMVCGAMIHATVAALGTALLLPQFPTALSWVAIVGGSFIILLGLRGIARALWSPSGVAERTAAVPQAHSFVVTGILMALSNAPLPLFYFVVVPQYIPAGMSRAGGVALLSAIHLAMAGTWMATLVTLLGKMADIVRRPRVSLVLQLASGAILVLLGAQAVASGV